MRALLLITVALTLPLCASQAAEPAKRRDAPVLQLEGGRRLEFVRTFSSDRDISTARGFWKRMVDVVAGPPDLHRLVRPFNIATDSHGRILITDPGAQLVHVFDFGRKKYSSLRGGKGQTFQSPIGIAVDARDNIYVADSERGKIYVFDPGGKFRRFIGDIKGEGYFKRPTGLAIDAAANRLLVTDTTRHAVFTLDLEGKVLGKFGKQGTGQGEFNYPTQVLVRGDEIIVLDAMNFRVQILDRQGAFKSAFGSPGDTTGTMFRAKGIALDSEGNLYVTDAMFETVQVFDRGGRILFYFGQNGSAPGEFALPAGLWIDSQDRIFVADSYNRRIQQFQFVSSSTAMKRR